ncbi:unnamed protein product [Ectocarpus sp. 13 AM-2016]
MKGGKTPVGWQQIVPGGACQPANTEARFSLFPYTARVRGKKETNNKNGISTRCTNALSSFAAYFLPLLKDGLPGPTVDKPTVSKEGILSVKGQNSYFTR